MIGILSFLQKNSIRGKPEKINFGQQCSNVQKKLRISFTQIKLHKFPFLKMELHFYFKSNRTKQKGI